MTSQTALLKFLKANLTDDNFGNNLDISEVAKEFFCEIPEDYHAEILSFYVGALKRFYEYSSKFEEFKGNPDNTLLLCMHIQLCYISIQEVKDFIISRHKELGIVDFSVDRYSKDLITTAQTLYSYFHEFYIRYDNKDSSIAEKIFELSGDMNLLKNFASLINIRKLSLTFTFDRFAPLDVTLKHLKEFSHNSELTIKLFNHACRDTELAGPLYGLTDETFRARDISNFTKKLDRLLFIYDNLYQSEIPTAAEILDLGEKVTEKFGVYVDSDKKETRRQITNDLLEAREYVRRAAALTFPY